MPVMPAVTPGDLILSIPQRFLVLTSLAIRKSQFNQRNPDNNRILMLSRSVDFSPGTLSICLRESIACVPR